MHTNFGEFEMDDVGFATGQPMLLGEDAPDCEYGMSGTADGKKLGTEYLTFELQVVAA